MKRLILGVLAVPLAAMPCLADVIPSKYEDKDPAQRQAVKARLVDLGVNASDAEHRVKHLDSDELAYFAQNPERIQPAGGLYWYEWVIGAGVIVVVVATMIALKVTIN